MIGAAKGPPPPPNYITLAGAKRLQEELGQLRSKERPKVVREVSDAAAQGDRSENAEYIYGKRRLREIDRRMYFLTRRLEKAVIVEPRTDGAAKIFFGAIVEVEDEDCAKAIYQIVGEDEIDLTARGVRKADARRLRVSDALRFVVRRGGAVGNRAAARDGPAMMEDGFRQGRLAGVVQADDREVPPARNVHFNAPASPRGRVASSRIVAVLRLRCAPLRMTVA